MMSIGEEDMKGIDVTKEAFKLLKASGLNFRGNIKGYDLLKDRLKWWSAAGSPATWSSRP